MCGVRSDEVLLLLVMKKREGRGGLSYIKGVCVWGEGGGSWRL